MLTLYVGDKTISTWSLRGWLAMKATGAAFTETWIPIYREGSTEALKAVSPCGTVPALVDDGVTIWDSLAIAEYLAEKFPAAGLWPKDAAKRAVARSVVAEMHSGFPDMRKEMPMRLNQSLPAKVLSADAQEDVDRVVEIWEGLLAEHGGPFLLGDYCLADIFYAPVAARLTLHGIPLPEASRAYAARLLATPEMREWTAAAAEQARA
jgi:glutathione S-transferase